MIKQTFTKNYLKQSFALILSDPFERKSIKATRKYCFVLLALKVVQICYREDKIRKAQCEIEGFVVQTNWQWAEP